MRLLCADWSYFAEKCIKFRPQPSRFVKIFRGKTPIPLLTWVEEGKEREKKEAKEGIKGFLYITLPSSPSYLSFSYITEGRVRGIAGKERGGREEGK